MTERLQVARRQAATARRWHSDWLTTRPLADAIFRSSSHLQGDRLLDIGCGNKPYRVWFPGAVCYVGVDAVRTNSQADVVALTDRLPFASETFDCALCTQVIEHVKRPAALLAEAWRVLRPGGKMLLSAPMYWFQHEEPHDFYRYTRYGLQYLLTSAGFEAVRWEQQGGAWRVTGQVLANSLSAAIRFRTFGLKALALLLFNTLFSWLDRLNYQRRDTVNLVVLACKT